MSQQLEYAYGNYISFCLLARVFADLSSIQALGSYYFSVHSDQGSIVPLLDARPTMERKDLMADFKLVFIVGYGPYRHLRNLSVATNLGVFPLKFRSKSYYANWHHALDELLVQYKDFWTFGRLKRIFLRLKRSISIGISRQNHLAGLADGFKASVLIPKKISYLKLVASPDIPIHISRTASKAGLVLSDFSKEMERVIRRVADSKNFYITSIESPRNRLNSHSDGYLFPNLISGLRSKDILRMDFQESRNVHQFRIPVNQYVQILNAFVTPQGVVGSISSKKEIRILDTEISHYWPSSVWKNTLTEEYLSPTVVGTIQIREPACYFSSSSNWAHFVEDNLPSILGLINQDISRPVYISANVSSIQRDALHELFPENTFIFMKKEYRYDFDDVIVNIHQDSRNDMILGIESNRPMIDFENLSKIRKIIEAKASDKSNKSLKVFISRNGGFRTLINRKNVESIFKDYGFLIVAAETLGFIERIKLFQSASIVAGETGAGLANLYLCKAGTRVIELRHPSVSNSKEHLALLSLTNHRYFIILGKKANAIKKLHYGVDSYIVDEDEVSCALKLYS